MKLDNCHEHLWGKKFEDSNVVLVIEKCRPKYRQGQTQASSPFKQTQQGREHGQKSNPRNRQEIQIQEPQNQIECLELQCDTKGDFANNEWENQTYIGWVKQDTETQWMKSLGSELWEM